VNIASCIFSLYLFNLPSLIIIAMNPIITKTKATLCKSYEIEIDPNMFISGIHTTPKDDADKFLYLSYAYK